MTMSHWKGNESSIIISCYTTLCLKKVPTIKIHMTLPTSPYACCYTTLGNKKFKILQIFSRYGRKYKQFEFLIASNFASRSPYWLQFSIHCCFICLLLRSICSTGNSSQQTPQQCLSTINMAFSDEDKIFDKMIKTHKYTQNTHLHA